MSNKLKTLAWYLRQPKGLSLVMNLIKQKTVSRKLEQTRDEAWAWGNERATDTTTALKTLFPNGNNINVDIESQFSKEFTNAKQKFESTPYKMGGPGNLALLYNICELINAKYVAETGVAYGWSSLSILLSIAKRSDSLLVSTDMPYANMGNDNFVGVVVSDELRSHWKLVREADVSGLPKALAAVPYLDVVHYDSDKSYIGRMKSYKMMYDKLRSGGVFISDDIQDNVGFRDYCAKLSVNPVVIATDNKLVGAFIKP